MNTYTVDVSRVVHDLLRKTITVEAHSREEALAIAEQMNADGKVELEFCHQVDSDVAEYEIVDGPEDPVPAESCSGGEWKIGEPIWLEDKEHYTRGAQRFLPIESHEEDRFATLALVLADEDDPECEANARLMRAAQSMLLNLREAMAYAESLNGGQNGEGARPPEGDDFNELWGFIKASIDAYEKGGA
jgi:hypothetical protein